MAILGTIVILILLSSKTLYAQKTYTLIVFSKTRKKDRKVNMTTPDSYKYQSDDFLLPVIYILDGQQSEIINLL